MIKINNNFKEKSEIYCKCGRFICYIKQGWLHTPKGIKTSNNGELIILKCSCGEKIEIKVK